MHKFSLYGKVFNIVAVFPDTEQGIADANKCMEAISSLSVLATHEGWVLLARTDDLGEGTAGVQENPHWL